MSLAAECALPGVPLALVAAALADGHAGLQQRPGDGRVVLPSGGFTTPRVAVQISVRSRHSRMYLTISARSCSRKPASAMPAGTAEQPGHGRTDIAIWSPLRRDRALRAPRPERWQCAAAAAGPRGLAWPYLLPLTGRPMCPGWGGSGAAGSIGAFALPRGGGLTDHVSG
jgi:hypothetical protein